jgi:hypothetical protein
MKENTLAFISGSVSGMLAGIGQQVLTTAILGIVGGMAGIAGKELYNHLKTKTKSWKQK